MYLLFELEVSLAKTRAETEPLLFPGLLPRLRLVKSKNVYMKAINLRTYTPLECALTRYYCYLSQDERETATLMC